MRDLTDREALALAAAHADDDDDGIPVTYELWPDLERGPFLVALYWQEVEGRMEVVGVELRSVQRPEWWGGEPHSSPLPPHNEPERLTRTVLRDLPLGAIADRHRSMSQPIRVYRVRGGVRQAWNEDLYRKAKELWATQKRIGRKGHGPDFYRDVARVYVKAHNEGRPPTQAVAEWAGGDRQPQVKGGWSNYATAAKYVSRARNLGLLPPAKTGAKR